MAAGYLHGSVRLSEAVRGKPRKFPVWTGRYRLPSGKDSVTTLGKAWVDLDLWESKHEVKLMQSRPKTGFLTRSQAEAALQRFLDENAESVPEDRKTFRRGCDEFLLRCEREKQLRGSTLHEYRRIATKLCERSWGNRGTWAERPLDTFTDADLLAIRTEMLDQSKSPHTINQVRGVVRGAFGERKVVQSWKWVGIRRRESRGKIRFYTPAQITQLKLATPEARDRAIFTLAAEAGLRMSEIRGLKIPHLDFANRLIRIEDGFTTRGGHAGTKGHSVRSVPLTDNVHFAVWPFCEKRAPFNQDGEEVLVFMDDGAPLDYDKLYKRFKKAVRTAGLHEITFHELRHSYGTNLISSGVDIHKLQRWMGHEHITTTEIYLHFQPDPDAAAKLSKLWESDQPDQPAEVVQLRKRA